LGFNTAQTSRHAVVVEAVPAQPDAPVRSEGVAEETRDLVGLDPATGNVRWSFSTRPDANAAYLDDGDEDFLVELARDGTLRLYDLDTGAVASTVKLAEGPQIAGFDLVGGLLLAVQGRSARLSAYDIRTGGLVWQRSAVRDGFLHDCGAILCLGRDTSISGIGWDTGQEVWRLDGYVAFRELDAGHLLATRTHELDSTGAIVEATTGRVVGRIPGWMVLAPDGDGVVVWQPDRSGGALIGRLDRATGRVDVFGASADWFAGTQCDAEHGFLACRGATRLSIWQLPGR
jgi:outer membrane protein assembly factor BamB